MMLTQERRRVDQPLPCTSKRQPRLFSVMLRPGLDPAAERDHTRGLPHLDCQVQAHESGAKQRGSQHSLIGSLRQLTQHPDRTLAQYCARCRVQHAGKANMDYRRGLKPKTTCLLRPRGPRC